MGKTKRRNVIAVAGILMAAYLTGPQVDTAWNVYNGIELDLTNPPVRLLRVDMEPVYEEPSPTNNCGRGSRVPVPGRATPSPRPACAVVGSRLIVLGFDLEPPFRPKP